MKTIEVAAADTVLVHLLQIAMTEDVILTMDNIPVAKIIAVTEPLSDDILDKLYRDREEDDASIRQLIAAQPKGIE